MTTAEALQNSKIVVIKIGTVLIVDENGQPRAPAWFETLAQDIDSMRKNGQKVLIVSSGAVALGRKALKIPFDRAPKDIPLEKKQACSAVGQFEVFRQFYYAFSKVDISVAQVLLTMSETENRRMHLNARATLNELLENDVVPIINENDTISTGEIRFGDNDRLATRVAQMIEADTVLILSTTDGFYTANPDKDEYAMHFPVLDKITDDHFAMAGEAVPGMSTGGMKSKLEAAQSAITHGINLIIAKGFAVGIIGKLFNDNDIRSTLFKAEDNLSNAKKRWIGAHLNPKGVVTIDNGALKALKSGKSLLPVGVKSAEGHFERGDILEIRNEDGQKLGMGVSAFNSIDTVKIIGNNSDKIAEILGYIGRSELIHRNDMVLQG